MKKLITRIIFAVTLAACSASSSSLVAQVVIPWTDVDKTGSSLGDLTTRSATDLTSGLLAGAYGGTGVANTGKTITLGGNVTTSGAFNLSLTLTGNTTLTIPTSGTLATVSGALGTPTSLTLTNATGLPISTGVTDLGTGVATALGNTPNATGGLTTYSGDIGAASATSLLLTTQKFQYGVNLHTTLQANSNNDSTRLYLMPKGNPGAGLQSGIKVFGTDFSADQVNYDDFGIYNTDVAHFINSKVNGTGTAKNIRVTYDDTNVIATFTRNKNLIVGDSADISGTGGIKATGQLTISGTGINTIAGASRFGNAATAVVEIEGSGTNRIIFLNRDTSTRLAGNYDALTHTFLAGSGTTAMTIASSGLVTVATAVVAGVQALSGAGAVDVITQTTALTTTGAAQALTLANASNGQTKTIAHVVDGGSAILTPTTKTGFSTVTFTNAGETVTLRYLSSGGWVVLAAYGATVAP